MNEATITPERLAEIRNMASAKPDTPAGKEMQVQAPAIVLQMLAEIQRMSAVLKAADLHTSDYSDVMAARDALHAQLETARGAQETAETAAGQARTQMEQLRAAHAQEIAAERAISAGLRNRAAQRAARGKTVEPNASQP